MGQFIRYLFLESYSIRKILFSFSGIGLIIGISERLLKRKHRLWPLILVLSLKILLFIPIDYFLLMHPGIDPTTDKAVQIYCFWRDVLMSAFFIWTYGGNNGKTPSNDGVLYIFDFASKATGPDGKPRTYLPYESWKALPEETRAGYWTLNTGGKDFFTCQDRKGRELRIKYKGAISVRRRSRVCRRHSKCRC